MKRFTLYSLSALGYMLLSSSSWVNLTLMRPSELQLPESVRSIAMIDRSLQEESRKNKTEQILTGEAYHADEQGVFQLMDGFLRTSTGSGRYETVRTAERYISDGTKSTFPTPLAWDSVTAICQRNKTDAVLSVEFFDSDFIIAPTPSRIETNSSGPLPIRIEFKVTGVVVINLGVRLYDGVNHVILDEYQHTYRMNFDAQGASVQEAMNTLLDRVEATKQAGYEAGLSYGQRITPTYYRATRYFFNKPKKALGKGVRYSEVADWKSAIDAWMPVVDGGSRKKAGRAAFNIAVAHEVLGDLEKAKEWAARSHTDFREKEADDYYRVLNNRIAEEGIVEEQMK